MRSKRSFGYFALAMSLATALAACGGSSNSDSGVNGVLSNAPDAFMNQVLALVLSSPDNTEPTSIDSIAVTTPDNLEPLPIS